jgi:hypothetical protein
MWSWAARETKAEDVCYNFEHESGVVQLVARQPLELVILVRVQAPEPNFYRLARGNCCPRAKRVRNLPRRFCSDFPGNFSKRESRALKIAEVR